MGQDAESATWLIGEGVFTDEVEGRAIRSMKEPGTAYDDDLLGKDPQPDHFDRYIHTDDDNGGVHLNSGIPNRAFALAAVELGGFAWEHAGRVWYDVLTSGRLRPDTDFHTFAAETVRAAQAAIRARLTRGTRDRRRVGVRRDRGSSGRLTGSSAPARRAEPEYHRGHGRHRVAERRPGGPAAHVGGARRGAARCRRLVPPHRGDPVEPAPARATGARPVRLPDPLRTARGDARRAAAHRPVAPAGRSRAGDHRARARPPGRRGIRRPATAYGASRRHHLGSRSTDRSPAPAAASARVPAGTTKAGGLAPTGLGVGCGALSSRRAGRSRRSASCRRAGGRRPRGRRPSAGAR